MFELTAARTISLKAGEVSQLILYLPARDFSIFKIYGSITLHHVKIRRIVLSSQGAFSGSPFMIASIVSAQCRLYGTTQSGSSWCIWLHPEHIKRLIMRFDLSPLLSINFLNRQPRTNSGSPQIGQTLVTFDITKSFTALLYKAVIRRYNHLASLLARYYTS